MQVRPSTAADAAPAGPHPATAVGVRFAGIATATAAGAASGNRPPVLKQRGRIGFARPSLGELEEGNIRGHGSLTAVELAGQRDSHRWLGSDLASRGSAARARNARCEQEQYHHRRQTKRAREILGLNHRSSS